MRKRLFPMWSKHVEPFPRRTSLIPGNAVKPGSMNAAEGWSSDLKRFLTGRDGDKLVLLSESLKEILFLHNFSGFADDAPAVEIFVVMATPS
mmetsp:Transcript_17610/g.27606  ORF Transcript_17610/g.27606 Transcript_17610/m.27606 type:complete len:92 (-) Transcript_17610:254-529(-)